MYCGNCGFLIPHGVGVCPNCGVQAGFGRNYCKNCGNPIAYGAAFCSNCGAQLSASAVPARRSRIVAGLLGIFLGGLGIHNFYLGFTGRAICQIILSACTFGMASIWGFIEGILILCGSYRLTDARGIYLDR